MTTDPLPQKSFFAGAGAWSAVTQSVSRSRIVSKLAHSLNVNMTALPKGVMNALPRVAELNVRFASQRSGKKPPVSKLNCLPRTKQNLALFHGSLEHDNVLLRAYGNSQMTTTATTSAWWLRHSNSQDSLKMNTPGTRHFPREADVSTIGIFNCGNSSELTHESPGACCGTLPSAARPANKICWRVYDPVDGDSKSQTPPGKAVADVPAHGTNAESGSPLRKRFYCRPTKC